MKKLLLFLPLLAHPSELSVRWSNDAFTFQETGTVKGELSDDNYTQGLHLEYRRDDLKLYAGQDIYTPTVLIVPFAVPSDRPYASFLYLGATRVKESPEIIREESITVGVVGPTAMGEGVQTEWHRLTKDIEVRGWKNQLSDEPVLNFKEEVRLPAVIAPLFVVQLGNLRTSASAGVEGNLGPFSARFERERVFRDIFLDGNSFRDGPSVPKKDWMSHQTYSVKKRFGEQSLGFSYHVDSQAFEGQVGDGNKYGGHKWGAFEFATKL